MKGELAGLLVVVVVSLTMLGAAYFNNGLGPLIIPSQEEEEEEEAQQRPKEICEKNTTRRPSSPTHDPPPPPSSCWWIIWGRQHITQRAGRPASKMMTHNLLFPFVFKRKIRCLLLISFFFFGKWSCSFAPGTFETGHYVRRGFGLRLPAARL